MRLHLRADDGIRTRDPHLGKVMRYQLRYIRAQRTRSSPGAKDDDSPIKRAHTNLLVRAASRLSRDSGDACGGFRDARLVLVFDVVRLSAPVPWLSGRASASHAEGRWFDPSRDHKCRCRSPALHVSDFRSVTHNSPGLSAVYPPSGTRSSSEPVERMCHTIQVRIIEIR